MHSHVKAAALAAAAAVAITAADAAEGPHVAPLVEYAQSTISGWMADPIVVDAIRAQNERHASLSDAEIEALDQQWRTEVDAASRPLIDEMMARALSDWLKSKREDSQGFVTEVFVMDMKGLNVGQSDVTSDYWQGDEAKWQETYLKGPGMIFVDEIEQDESTQMLQSQVSMSVIDPETNEVIGAVTVGVNVDQL